MGDAALLLKWKNEADTRANSIVTGAMIRKKDHRKWLKGTLKRVKEGVTAFYVVMVDGKAAGDVRIEDETEISIRMDKKFRGRGLATQVIALFNGSGPLVAKIRTHNVASMRCFMANGYRPISYVGGDAPYLIFEK